MCDQVFSPKSCILQSVSLELQGFQSGQQHRHHCCLNVDPVGLSFRSAWLVPPWTSFLTHTDGGPSGGLQTAPGTAVSSHRLDPGTLPPGLPDSQHHLLGPGHTLEPGWSLQAAGVDMPPFPAPWRSQPSLPALQGLGLFIQMGG